MKKPLKKKILKAARKKNGSSKKLAAKKPAVKKKIPAYKKYFPIVGMGGSAGSFSAFEKFFTHIPSDSGMAFVLILHLDPNHKGKLSEVIQTYTPMPVVEAADGLKIRPDHVYVIPPNKDLAVHDGKLLLLVPASQRSARMPIDYFFQSLAEDQWNNAVAIIFSGMGTDGETGLRMIKEKLGMAMVQDPQTAEYDSMPNAALSTNLVDYLLAPEDMPIKLIQYLKHPALREEFMEQSLMDSRNATSIQKILMILRSQTGHDFTHYKINTITRRIDRRIAFHQLADYSKYVNFLRENPQEIIVLFNELLIGVTKFFRDKAAFEGLKSKLFRLFHLKDESEPIRIWVAGCSTGEEAYSLSIIVAEYLETIKGKKAPKVQIFATDLDAEAIEHAREGIYLENIIADVSPDRLQKYFIKKNDAYQVKKELREMIVFAQHNLIRDAPFTKLDLLSCRNLLIYLNSTLQKKIIPVFHYSLNTKGLLMLGPAENIGGFTDLFQLADPKWKLFERKEGNATVNKMIDFPFNISSHTGQALKAEAYRGPRKLTLLDTFNKLLLDNYTPPAVLIDERGDILYVNGKTSGYLELGSGEAVMNIHRMAREELKYAISNAIYQVKSQKTVVTIKDIKLKNGKKTSSVTLGVCGFDDVSLQGLFLIMFEDGGEILTNKKGIKNNAADHTSAKDLEKELMFTKQQLHSTIEQMETSVEELKSTNEELQSTNEELQSTNEESLTTKEEMQSLNEELMTINMQYQSKAEELTEVNNDMKNLLDNTEIGTIFLDNTLKVLRYTPQVLKVFNLIQTDVGRSITHVVSNFNLPSLEEDIREVIEKLSAKELEINTNKGDWYKLRIMPYRTMDNFISGAVLTFHTITYLKSLEEKLELIRRASEVLVDAVREPAVMLDHHLNVIMANGAFKSVFKLKESPRGKSLNAILGEQIKSAELEKLLIKAQKGEAHILVKLNGGGSRKSVKMIAKKIMNDKNGKAVILLTMSTKEDGRAQKGTAANQ